MYTAIAVRLLVGVFGMAIAAAAQTPPAATQDPKPAAPTAGTQTSAPSASSQGAAGGGAAASQPGPVPPVSLVGRAVVQFDASKSEGTSPLRIVSPTDRNVVLEAGALIDPQTKETIVADVKLQPTELRLVANVPQTVTATVSGVLVDGSAEFEVLAGTTRVGTVTVTRGPFAVSLAAVPVTFETGKTTVLTLRNDSRHPYTVRWMVNLGPHRYCGEPAQGTGARTCDEAAMGWDAVRIPPKDSNQIRIVPPAEWFDTSVTAKQENVTLSLAPGPDLPKRVQQVAVTLVGTRVAWQPAFILWWLLLGAVMSLLVRHWVPNTQRKRDLKEQTNRVRAKIDAFSDDIDYELRAQTRVQGHLLESLRRSAYTAFPHYESVATQCAAGLAMLEKRVDLIEEIDSVFAIERVKWQSCPPPSQIDRVEAMLRGAIEALKKAHLSEPDFLAVKGEVDRARTLTNQMGSEGAEFGQELATRLKATADELATYNGTDAYKELQALLPGLLGSVTPPAAGGTAPGEISPLRYSLVDYNLSALQICRDYIWLTSGAAGANKPSAVIRDALVQHLARHSWGELRLARLLLKQFREDAFEEQIWKEIEAGDAGIYVVHEPTELRPLQLVQFRIYFRRSELNWAGAKDLVSPEWQFSDGSQPRGWAISQFFTGKSLPTWRTKLKRRWKGKKEEDGPATEDVFVHFEGRPDDKGNVRRKKNALTLKLQIQPSRAEGRRARTVTEALGLAVSIAIPFITLATTASAQLAQNPTGGGLMIFLLGFSSDALIAVFKQRATGTP